MQTDNNNPYAPPPIPQQVPQTPPQFGGGGATFQTGQTFQGGQAFPTGQGRAGFLQPHRGGLILGLGIGSLGTYAAGCVTGTFFPPCGILGLVAVGLGIAAWVMGNSDVRAMRAGTMDVSGLSNTNTGKVLGMISVILFGVLLLLLLVMIVFAGALVASILGGAAAGAAAGGGAGGP
jgi:hypothetical protein